VSLAEAVAQMNRYSRRPITLAGDPRLATLRISGVYRAGDSEGFAQAVAALHGLSVQPDSDRLVTQAAPAAVVR
jgi:transmembrane sensor